MRVLRRRVEHDDEVDDEGGTVAPSPLRPASTQPRTLSLFSSSRAPRRTRRARARRPSRGRRGKWSKPRRPLVLAPRRPLPMCSRGVWQLQKLTVRYCGRSGASAGVRCVRPARANGTCCARRPFVRRRRPSAPPLPPHPLAHPSSVALLRTSRRLLRPVRASQGVHQGPRGDVRAGEPAPHRRRHRRAQQGPDPRRRVPCVALPSADASLVPPLCLFTPTRPVALTAHRVRAAQ